MNYYKQIIYGLAVGVAVVIIIWLCAGCGVPAAEQFTYHPHVVTHDAGIDSTVDSGKD